MNERPILMTPELAQKVHEGRKTQTRRILKGDGSDWETGLLEAGRWQEAIKCPYGVVGDRLWVRENGWERPLRTVKMLRDGADTWERFYYDALMIDGEADELKSWGFKRRPSIHMPRLACRTVVEITEIRVERVQDITADDIRAEGVKAVWPEEDEPESAGGKYVTEGELLLSQWRQLWQSIHGKGSWALNPWVWVLTFRKIKEVAS